MPSALIVAYGVIHDQITARLCVEYFTVGGLATRLRVRALRSQLPAEPPEAI